VFGKVDRDWEKLFGRRRGYTGDIDGQAMRGNKESWVRNGIGQREGVNELQRIKVVNLDGTI
jgi:hypothetical protein